ncbi:MAG: hypothetical protein COT91_00875 [Candidatus Doudnabacteria bacterium CG10_big_fil_rev_8_21_14_0_10_41_10]|uniref:Four helix bundle protein n=1 Tax=Candidatus Doudnabacteria bacterium CG10_big_fil_rev_8_21_14_0_10_41_10 TaxID=1974551 RepID=A0A2H0VEM4_9BACT|nr:MAG: hypothetical protein COT91_00875 [Candidatus Doudnabacteria bacterium CG10_big_fil_rev_8_21_14_0_10_41_10]
MKEKIYFYTIALGSLTELQNQIIVSRDIGYINGKMFNSLAEKTVRAHKLINGMIKYFKNT